MQILSKNILLILLFTSFISNAASKQEQIEIIHSKFSEPLVFNVILPSGYTKNTSKSYVMMFDLHPKSDTYLRGMHDWMSHNGEWPWLKTIIVTPVAGNKVGGLFDATGKTTPLLNFFDEQLFPLLDNKYRTNGFRIMSGFRENGAIVLSSLINKPNMIDAYIAISPELKNDYVNILSTSSSKLAKLNDKPRFLLFSHGTNVKEEHQMKSYKKLKTILSEAAPEKLDWHYKHYNESYFMSLPLLSVIFGVENIFDDIHNGLSPTSKISQKGVEAIVKHYEYLSKEKYGFTVSPKNALNKLGAHLLTLSKNDGISIFKDMVKRYPNDAYSHHNLASAYARIGDLKKAIKHQEDAVELADKMQTWHKKRHRNFLDEYKNKSHDLEE
ncbi:MAG: tetratricopeptide repeat protein [Litorilituus sp.]|jgi:hypothetical protein|nr:tetratricopeptide repeat protein [Litorilituus sp.]